MPQLLVRINQALLSYCLDTELYGDMPFSRYERRCRGLASRAYRLAELEKKN
jgi:hypothetical protein